MVNALSYINTKRRRARQDFSMFAALVDTPGNLATGVTLPARAVVFIGTSSALAVSTVLVDTSTGRSLGAPAGVAGAVNDVGFLEAGVVLTKAAGAPGTVSLYVRDPAGVPQKIAEG